LERATAIVGGSFVATFVLGLVLVGETAGSFAEPDDYFPRHFASSSQRIEDLVGSFFLLAAAIALLVFARLVSMSRSDVSVRGQVSSAVVQASGTLAAVGLFVAAVSLATVPASIVIGEIFDDPGIIDGQALPPQIGYVALVGAMVSAAVMIVMVPQVRRLPRWIARVGYVLALLLLIGSPAVAPAILLAVWVGLASVAMWRSTS
jgi:hypothetical protein